MEVALERLDGQQAVLQLHGVRHRDRHRARQAVADFRGLRAGRCVDHAAIRRHGPWPDDLRAAGGADGRPDLDRERARQGQPFSLLCAVRACSRRAARPSRPRPTTSGTSACSWSMTTPPTASSSTRCSPAGRCGPSSVDSARAALAELSRAMDAGRPYHLVLTDALMPDVDGFTLARQIEADTAPDGREGDHADVRGPAARPQPRGEHLRTADQTRQALGPARCHPERLRAGRLGRALARRPADLHADAPHRTFSILVAEDNLTNQKLVILLLEGRGHRVTTVSDGRQAVAKATETRTTSSSWMCRCPRWAASKPPPPSGARAGGRRAHADRRDDGARHGRGS